MNELCSLFENLNGKTVALEANKIYRVKPEDCFHFFGLYCSNTAFKSENPDGERFAAAYSSGGKNITIEGNNAIIEVSGIITPLVFTRVKNLTVKDLRIDYVRPTMSEFCVISAEKGKIRVKIADEFLYEIQNGKLFWVGEKDKTGKEYFRYPYKGDGVLSQTFNPQTCKLKMLPRGENDKMPSVPDLESVTEVQNGVLDMVFKDKTLTFPVGTVFQTRSVARKQVGGIFDECKNLTLQNVEINAMNGMGLVFQNCDTVRLNGVKCVPGKGRTICCNADFFHFSGCKGKITVENCTAIGAHDDVINVHGTHLQIVEQNPDDKSIVVKFRNAASWGFNAYKMGEKIEFVKNQTLLPYGKNRVKKAQVIDDYTVKLFLTRKLPKAELGKDVIENVTRTARLVVKNNYFERISSRAILCTTRKKVVIKNNVFKNICGPVLYVADDCNFWYESGRSGVIKFINNTVDGCDYGFTGEGEYIIQSDPVVTDKTSKTPVHKAIIIKNNKFLNPTKDKFYFKFAYLKKRVIKNNYFDNGYEES